MRSFRIFLATLLAAASLTAEASDSAPYFTRHLPPTQRVFIENIQLTVKDFLAAYMSKSEAERRYAELYLLGVLDATEGSLWCSYKRFKTDAIGETLYMALEDLKPSQQTERASKIITETLSSRYPCKEASK
jgi:hypothetical protein